LILSFLPSGKWIDRPSFDLLNTVNNNSKG
jgi:hypothetical protein